MKIAIIAPTEIPARRANTIQVMKMAQALQGLGHTVRVAVPSAKLMPRRKNSNDTRPHEVDWGFLKQHYGLSYPFPIDQLPAQPFFRRYDFSLFAVHWARGWNAELLYTRLPQAAALASNLGIKTILESHDMPQGQLGPWLFRLFLKGKGACRLVVITQALADDLARDFGAPISKPFTIIAPDGVDLERYADLPSPGQARSEILQNGVLQFCGLQPGRFTAGYTGNLYPGRGASILLHMARRLPEILFLIVGGEQRDIQKMRERIAAEEITNIVLTGFVPNAELPRYQAACEVLLMPYQRVVSASSGGDIGRYLSPMKLFEYMACERAILSSDLPVLREILNPDNAILLPAHDPDAWVDALNTLQADPDRMHQLAAQARRDVRQYTWDSRAKNILEELDSQAEL
jgi:glycosyltransferase involved in cell wall biosynthesis